MVYKIICFLEVENNLQHCKCTKLFHCRDSVVPILHGVEGFQAERCKWLLHNEPQCRFTGQESLLRHENRGRKLNCLFTNQLKKIDSTCVIVLLHVEVYVFQFAGFPRGIKFFCTELSLAMMMFSLARLKLNIYLTTFL